jgi:TRAP-type mannitol/chloroaromatic compound transport system permease small subunit
MLRLAERIDRISSAIGRAAAWLILVVVVAQFAVVLLRYGFGMGSIRLQESVVYAHALAFMLAAAWTLKAGAHVRVDVF